MNDYLVAWLTAFVWTNAFELPVYALLVGPRLKHWWSAPVLTLCVNLVTHPVFSWWVFASQPDDAAVRWCEAVIALVEGALVAITLRRGGTARPWLLGLGAGVCANGVSYGAGLLWFAG